jgi:hypothetical protein
MAFFGRHMRLLAQRGCVGDVAQREHEAVYALLIELDELVVDRELLAGSAGPAPKPGDAMSGDTGSEDGMLGIRPSSVLTSPSLPAARRRS